MIEVGTADEDRELYLLDSLSGDRLAELRYVGETKFEQDGITYFEPARGNADLENCPKDVEALKLSEQQRAVIMYSAMKQFDPATGDIKDLNQRGCYPML